MLLRPLTAAAMLLVTTAANAEFKDVVARRFSSNAENLIVNLPPRPSTWPGAIFTFNTRFPIKNGEPNDPALHRGEKVGIQASDGLVLDAGTKASVWSFLRLPATTADSADVVMSFPDAQAVDMSVPDLVRHVEMSDAAATAARRGQIPLIVARAYVGTPLVTVSRKADAPAEAWAKIKAGLDANAQRDSSSQDSVSYTAGDIFVFAFEVNQISYDPTELARGSIRVNLAALPTSLFEIRERDSDQALAAAQSAISAITGLSVREVEQKWTFVGPAAPTPITEAPPQQRVAAPPAAAPRAVVTQAPVHERAAPPAAVQAPVLQRDVPHPVARPPVQQRAAVRSTSVDRASRHLNERARRVKPRKHRRPAR